MNDATEPLTRLSRTDLVALAEGQLAPASQARLDALIAANAEDKLTDDELTELDNILQAIDQLNLLKARALVSLLYAEDLPT